MNMVYASLTLYHCGYYGYISGWISDYMVFHKFTSKLCAELQHGFLLSNRFSSPLELSLSLWTCSLQEGLALLCHISSATPTYVSIVLCPIGKCIISHGINEPMGTTHT